MWDTDGDRVICSLRPGAPAVEPRVIDPVCLLCFRSTYVKWQTITMYVLSPRALHQTLSLSLPHIHYRHFFSCLSAILLPLPLSCACVWRLHQHPFMGSVRVPVHVLLSESFYDCNFEVFFFIGQDPGCMGYGRTAVHTTTTNGKRERKRTEKKKININEQEYERHIKNRHKYCVCRANPVLLPLIHSNFLFAIVSCERYKFIRHHVSAHTQHTLGARSSRKTFVNWNNNKQQPKRTEIIIIIFGFSFAAVCECLSVRVCARDPAQPHAFVSVRFSTYSSSLLLFSFLLHSNLYVNCYYHCYFSSFRLLPPNGSRSVMRVCVLRSLLAQQRRRRMRRRVNFKFCSSENCVSFNCSLCALDTSKQQAVTLQWAWSGVNWRFVCLCAFSVILWNAI